MKNSIRRSRLLVILREAREEAGLTQEDLARRVGSRQSWVSKYEVGRRRLDVDTFLLMCEVLKLDPCSVIKDLQAARLRLRSLRKRAKR